MKSDSIYTFEAAKLNGDRISLEQYKEKVVLIVNTASSCGLTPQYEGLEKLYQKYKDQGLVVLGFPCNQFGQQEQGSSEEIQEFCQVNYGVSFPMFEKVEVNGEGAHPLFKYLKSKLSGGLFGRKIKWNFTKFLIDRNGQPIKRFKSITAPAKIEQDIQVLLKKH
jgi:glutathione peroxidase